MTCWGQTPTFSRRASGSSFSVSDSPEDGLKAKTQKWNCVHTIRLFILLSMSQCDVQWGPGIIFFWTWLSLLSHHYVMQVSLEGFVSFRVFSRQCDQSVTASFFLTRLKSLQPPLSGDQPPRRTNVHKSAQIFMILTHLLIWFHSVSTVIQWLLFVSMVTVQTAITSS